MRILPIALVDPPDDAAELIDRAHRSSAITHGAPECLAARAAQVAHRCFACGAKIPRLETAGRSYCGTGSEALAPSFSQPREFNPRMAKATS